MMNQRNQGNQGNQGIVINVAAAAISRCDVNGNKEYFTAQRNHGELKGLYEFPGGKIEEGETPEDAIKREIREELKAEIVINDSIGIIDYDYTNFHLHMQVFECHLITDSITLTEHKDAKWISASEFDRIAFAPADAIVADVICKKELVR